MDKRVEELLYFIDCCDEELNGKILNFNNLDKAKFYLETLKCLSADDKSAILKASEDKLRLIIKKYQSLKVTKKQQNSGTITPEKALNLIDGNITDYVVSLIKTNFITDPLLIARYAYLELSKYVYYNTTYFRTSEEAEKSYIVDFPVNPETANIFSYVVCTQWFTLYAHILKQFNINVKRMNRPGEDHVWAEIDLPNDQILIADATEYINGTIDLSNAKSNSPTGGFVVMPKEYSGFKLCDIKQCPYDSDVKMAYNNALTLNRELDTSLQVIKNGIYPYEIILNENDLFQCRDSYITDQAEAARLMEEGYKFFANLPIPNNMDGYEVFAYYKYFIQNLPAIIRGHIGMSSLYIDTYKRPYRNNHPNYLKTDIRYLEYLKHLLQNRYYEYLPEDAENELLRNVATGVVKVDDLIELAAKQELKQSSINRRYNHFYTINEMVFYNYFGDNDKTNYLFYEPTMGMKKFKSMDEAVSFKENVGLKK